MYIPSPMRIKGRAMVPIRLTLDATRGWLTRWYATMHQTPVKTMTTKTIMIISYTSWYAANTDV
jgi:hypothetical protein